MTVVVESVTDPDSVLDELMPELEQAMIGFYGEPDPNDPFALMSSANPEYFVLPRGRLWTVKVDGVLAGMSGWTDLSQLKGPNPFADLKVAELKRLFVRPQFQGLGLARKLDEYRLNDIFMNGYDLAVGEAGQPQRVSCQMHTVAPYFEVEPFGEYFGNDESVFFGCTPRSWQAWAGMRLEDMKQQRLRKQSVPGNRCER